MKLFIIGNGFDRIHGLPTAYYHFRQYLLDNYEKCDYLLNDVTTFDPKNGEKIDLNAVASNLLYLLDEMEDYDCDNDIYWGDFEEDLGKFNYNEIFHFESSEDEKYMYRDYNAYDMRAEEFSKISSGIEELFTNWIENEIDWESATVQDNFKQLFSNNDLFLTFNYTPVLEEIYGIDKSRICHIHGEIGNKLIFGHNSDVEEPELRIDTADAVVSASNVYRSLRKKTDDCISKNYDFLDKISDASDIYIIGWGMGKSDDAYIELLKKKLKGKKFTIHFTDHDKDKINDFKLLFNEYNYEIGDLI